ncbi:MAG: hypothetical protein ABI080_22200, partial [Candidatus Binatia bacterium]
MAKTTRGTKGSSGGKNGKTTSTRGGDGSAADVAWAKATAGGPSKPPPAPVSKGRGRSGVADLDAATGGHELAVKMAGTDHMAAKIPHNPLKASEYGDDNAHEPQAGETVEPP